MARHEGLLVIDEHQKLTGIITRGDVLRALEQGESNGTTVIEAGSHDLIVSFPDEVLHEAAAKMLRNNIGRLPVVSRQDSHRIVGYVGRSNLMAAHLRQLEEEHIRERRFPTPHPESNVTPIV